MIVDPLTKGMTLKVFQEHTAHMSVIPNSALVLVRVLLMFYILRFTNILFDAEIKLKFIISL